MGIAASLTVYTVTSEVPEGTSVIRRDCDTVQEIATEYGPSRQRTRTSRQRVPEKSLACIQNVGCIFVVED